MSPEQYCQEKAIRSGSSFYYSFLLLPPDTRRDITAYYAFCREVDDVVDECTDVGVARTKLAWWRSEIASTFAGRPSHPVGMALRAAIDRCALAEGPFQELISGMEMDLEPQRFPDYAALSLYCHRVAGVVGQVSASIFGYADARTLDYAHELGIAFQLTNIIRDVGEDARRDRLYLPLDELARFGVRPADLLARTPGEGFRPLMQFQADRAKATYRAALAALPDADLRAQRAGLAMAAIYRTLLAEIEREGFAVLDGKVSLTPLRKLWLAWRTWTFGLAVAT
jgi:15-cis-phytoene synthase